MSFRLARTKNVKLVRALHGELFPGTDFESPAQGNVYWLVYDEHGGAVAFASARAHTKEPGAAFLSRSGVVAGARGHGLQRRLIRARCAWARAQHFSRAVTYVHVTNIPSLRSLVQEHFVPYWPEQGRLAEQEWVYVERGL